LAKAGSLCGINHQVWPASANTLPLPASSKPNIMEVQPIKIEIYDKRLKMSATIYVDRVSESIFRARQNELFNCTLTLGTEFETRINRDGKHEIVKVTKKSDLLTYRFFLTSQFSKADYMLLGDEVIKHGGYWQVDFGGIAIVNLPKDSEVDLLEIFKIFDFNPTFIVDE
jgi:hypothetical protein